MKRTLSIILVVIMLASLMPAAFAEESDTAARIFVKANSIENDKEYLVVYTNGNTSYALVNDSSNNKLAVTSSNNTIALSSADAAKAAWTTSAVTDAAQKKQGDFYFKNGDHFIARATSTNALTFETSGTAYCAMSYSEGTLKNQNSKQEYTFYLSYLNDTFTFYNQNQPSNMALYVERTLDRIEITKSPTKTAYIVGESFNPAGMVITATYSDGTKTVIRNDGYTFDPSGALAIGVTNIKVTYQGKEATQAITVSAPATKVELTPPSLNLEVGETGELTATTTPTVATIKRWDTNSDVVSLDRNGYSCSVTAVKAGTATVTVTDINDNTETCTVTVTEPASSIILDKEKLTLEPGGSYKLKATTVPADTKVEWTVDDEGKGSVEVASDGTVTAKAVTSNPVTVTATTDEGKTASCSVEVVPETTQTVIITDPSSDIYSLGNVGAVKTFKARVAPEWTAENNNEIRWSSSDERVVKVVGIEPHGTEAHIQAVGSGSAYITASCGGVSDMVTVYVVSDYKFTAPTGKLIWYYDRNPQYNLEFSTSIPYGGIRRVVIQAGNRDYNFTDVAMQNTYGTVTIPYSALYTTFGRQTTTMTVKVYYGTGANDYIYKNLYYRSIYDAPLTADTDMTWAYVTMLLSGLFITASPFILKKKHQN